MNLHEMFVIAENALQVGGRVLLEVTAVLVLSYLLFFAGSLVVAAVRRMPSARGRASGSIVHRRLRESTADVTRTDRGRVPVQVKG